MKVSIIGGAGTLGTCAAFTLAVKRQADEIVLIDINHNLVKAHALDINLAVAGKGVDVYAGEDADIVGSDVVIITATVPAEYNTPPIELLKVNLPLIIKSAKNIQKYCPSAMVITASNPVDTLNYAMYLFSGLDCSRLMGYNINDSLRFRIAIARLLDVSADKIDGFVIGQHTGILAYLFSSVRVEGKVTSMNKEFKNLIRRESPKLLEIYSSYISNRTLGWTSGTGLADMVRAIGSSAGELTSCSAVLRGEYGFERISMGVPVILGRGGIRQILEWNLPTEEKDELNRAAASLQSFSDVVKQLL